MKKATIVVVFALCAASAFSQIFDIPQKLYTVRTKYFDIVFQEASKKSALYLANFADRAYEEVAAKLGTTPALRIPVLITPSCEDINGYFAHDPLLKIVLFETSISGNTELAFNDSLYKLFYHELTHFVSMTSLNRLMRTLYAIFGGWVYNLPVIQTPYNFIEGVTVSFESHDGYGRARDPLPGGQIRQEILEGKFKTFTQTMGTWDLYPRGGTIYWYGGYFSLYLQETYGMERYAELLRYFSNPINTQLLDDVGKMMGKFKEIYGITLETAWKDFGEHMSIKVPVVMRRAPAGAKAYYTGLAGSEAGALVYDAYKRAVLITDIKTGTRRLLFRHEAMIERMSVHPESGDILISTYSGSSRFPKQALEIFRGGKLVPLPFAKISDAVWAGASILAIETKGYTRSLVLITDRETTTLIRGTESINYLNPVSNEDGSVLYVLASESGITSIIRLGVKDGKAVSIEKLVLPDGLGWLRYLSYAKGRLLASWDDDKLYRLVEIGDSTVSYQSIPMSGGVHYPVATSGALAYLGFFSDGMALCAFPQDRSQLGFKEAQAVWEDASYLRDAQSIYDKTDSNPVKPYNGARWLLPAGWTPYISIMNGFRAGLNLQFAEPTETYSSALDVSWSGLTPETVDLSAAANLSLYPLAIQVSCTDSFFPASDPFTAYRLSSASASIFLGDSFRVGLSGVIQGYSEFTEADTSFYRVWDASTMGTMASLEFAITHGVFNDPSKYSGVTGFLLYQANQFLSPETVPGYLVGLEGGITGALGTPFIELTLEGAWTPNNTLYYGPMGLAYAVEDSVFPAPSSLSVYNEFATSLYSVWYAQIGRAHV